MSDLWTREERHDTKVMDAIATLCESAKVPQLDYFRSGSHTPGRFVLLCSEHKHTHLFYNKQQQLCRSELAGPGDTQSHVCVWRGPWLTEAGPSGCMTVKLPNV